eukprot:scaffold4304_cov192-Pinguiococcus_pyrenoidosus.AAC.2
MRRQRQRRPPKATAKCLAPPKSLATLRNCQPRIPRLQSCARPSDGQNRRRQPCRLAGAKAFLPRGGGC